MTKQTVELQPPSADDEARLKEAVNKIGQSEGLDAAAAILTEIASRKSRVVGTTELKEVAKTLRQCAEEARGEALALLAK